MKTMWHLIYHWQNAQAEVTRLEILASVSRQQAADFEHQLRPLLQEHGPVVDGGDLYRAPADPTQPVIKEKITEAMSVTLEKQGEDPK